MFELIIWAATIPLIPYAISRKHYDFFCGMIVLFLLLSITLMAKIEVPNPYNIILIEVTSE